MTIKPSISTLVALASWFGTVAIGGGCSPQTSSPATEGSSVEAAYSELVGEFAACAQTVSGCVQTAQGDTAALQACRDEFAGCRDSAGQAAVDSMANAVRTCTDANRQCEKDNHGATGSQACQQTLLACLEAGRPQHPGSTGDDEDGGTDHGAKGSHAPPVGDCLDTLHGCISGGGEAKTCAQAVRACVLDAVPMPDDVIPMGGPGAGGNHADAGHAGEEHVANPPANSHAADAGEPEDAPKPPREGEMHAADAGEGMSSPALACLDAFQACTQADGMARTCARSLQQCNKDARR
jgi:hypothetical protein